MTRIRLFGGVVALFFVLALPRGYCDDNDQDGFDLNKATSTAVNKEVQDDHPATSTHFHDPEPAKSGWDNASDTVNHIVKDSPVAPGIKTDEGYKPGITIRGNTP